MKTGLKTALNKKIFLILCLCLPNVYAQIPINGFCRYSGYKVPSGFSRIYAYNFNNDAFTDLLLFSPGKRSAVLLQGQETGDFSPGKTISFREPLSAIRNLSFGESYSQYYITISRKGKTAGLVKSSEAANLIFLDSHKFDSYPEHIDIADADNDNSPEILVTGPSFNGISVLGINKARIVERSIVKNKPFNDGTFGDLNNDSYPDIAAVNILELSLDFYINNSRGRFSLQRSFKLGNLPYMAAVTDMDLDKYNDIIRSEKGKIFILYGDEVSGFRNNTVINTKYNPVIFITGDFNRDGTRDIIYADTSAGVVSALLSSDSRKFSEELILFGKKNISSLIPYYSKFITGIAVLDKEGKIYTVTGLTRIPEELMLASGLNPGTINYFDHLDNGITDICYIDESEHTINFLLRDIEGIPEKIYKYQVNYPFSEITSAGFGNETYFYCWSRGQDLVEIIKADFINNTFGRTDLYCPGKIMDLKVRPVKNNPPVIYAACINDGNGCASIFEYHDFRYVRSDYTGFAPGTADVSVFLTPRHEGFYSWNNWNKLQLYAYDMKNMKNPKRIGVSSAGYEVFTVSGNFADEITPGQVSFIKGSSGQSLVFAGKKFNDIRLPDSLKISNIHQFWAGSLERGGINKLYIYLPDRKSLNLVTLYNKGKNLILSEVISGIAVKRYVVQNLDKVNSYIIYTDPEENCITINRIK